MKREALLHHLLQARQHVAEGRVHIARQHSLIADLEARGEDTSHARQTLAMFQRMQTGHIADAERIEKALDEENAVFSNSEDFDRGERARIVSRDSFEELRWYQAKLAETAQVLQSSKESVETSRQILLRFERVDPATVEWKTDPRS
jgi:hypothetical protein